MQIQSLTEALNIISSESEPESTKIEAALQGMLAHSQSLISNTEYFKDTLAVLDGVALAKANIDKASCHNIEIAKVTSSILFDAQEFVSKQTIPCTEWPSPKELVWHLEHLYE